MCLCCWLQFIHEHMQVCFSVNTVCPHTHSCILNHDFAQELNKPTNIYQTSPKHELLSEAKHKRAVEDVWFSVRVSQAWCRVTSNTNVNICGGKPDRDHVLIAVIVSSACAHFVSVVI